MTNLQVILSVVVSMSIYLLFLCLFSYFCKPWGKVVVVYRAPDAFDLFVTADFDVFRGFTCFVDEAYNFKSVRKARKVVRTLESAGYLNVRILEVFSVHKTGCRKSFPWF